MNFEAGRSRGSVAWIAAFALALQFAAARADDAPPPEGLSAPAETTVSLPESSPSQDRPLVKTGSAIIDLTPTGSTASPSRDRTPVIVVAPSSGEASLANSPPPGDAVESLLGLPLPPEAPPPALSAAIGALEPPQAAEAASPQAEPPAPPAAVDSRNDLSGAIVDAVDRLPEKVSSLGASDWKAAREAIREFYQQRANAPVWVDALGLTAAGRSALLQLNRASEDGLDLRAFTLPPESFADTQPERLAGVEATLSAAAVAYALEASGGRIAPTTISPLVAARPEVADPKAVLRQVAGAADPAQTLAGFNPPQKGYRALRAELARLRTSAPLAAAPPPPAGPTLRIGMVDARVPLIRARFGLGSTGDTDATRVYDVRVAVAVAAFQKSRGLAADGAFTMATTEALFGDPNLRREAVILANMEMWRWAPRDMGERRVEINVPDFTLRVMDGDQEVHRARVIVGKPDTPTPIFSNEIKYLLVNPIWRVPDSIVKKEMMPKLAGDPGYLTRRGFKVSQIGDRLIVEQPPGEANALGHILFMFPNEHAVYLHDTPSRALFASAERAFSHGCIRVEQPMRLAELFMGGAARGWSAGRIESMIGSNERTVFLPQPLPIHIQYFTEFVDASGALQSRDDVYGLTARVAATLSRMRQY